MTPAIMTAIVFLRDEHRPLALCDRRSRQNRTTRWTRQVMQNLFSLVSASILIFFFFPAYCWMLKLCLSVSRERDASLCYNN